MKSLHYLAALSVGAAIAAGESTFQAASAGVPDEGTLPPPIAQVAYSQVAYANAGAIAPPTSGPQPFSQGILAVIPGAEISPQPNLQPSSQPGPTQSDPAKSDPVKSDPVKSDLGVIGFAKLQGIASTIPGLGSATASAPATTADAPRAASTRAASTRAASTRATPKASVPRLVPSAGPDQPFPPSPQALGPQAPGPQTAPEQNPNSRTQIYKTLLSEASQRLAQATPTRQPNQVPVDGTPAATPTTTPTTQGTAPVADTPTPLSPTQQNDKPTAAPAKVTLPDRLESQPLNPLLRPDQAPQVEIDLTQPLSLDQAVEIARRNNKDIIIRELELERSKAALEEARAALKPTLSVQGGFQQSGRSEFTDVIQSKLGGDDNSARRHSTAVNGDFRLDYNLIDPSRRPTIQAAEKRVEQAQLTLDERLAELRLRVSGVYYDLQLADEQVRISQRAVEAAQRSLKDAQALERAGVGTKFAVLQSEVQLANEQQTLINAQGDQQTGQRRLARDLQVPHKVNVLAADKASQAGQWDLSLADSVVLAYKNRVELDNQLVQREIADFQREAALGAIKPRVGLFAQVGVDDTLTYNRTGNTNPLANGSSLQNNTGVDYSFGLNLRWNFYDGGAARASARQREVDKAIAEQRFADARDGIRLQVEEAYYDLGSNLKNISTARKGIDQASDALRLARLRFQAGVGTQTDVVNAERDLTRAEGNLVTAIVNYNRALVQMQRAVGVGQRNVTPWP